MCYDPAAKVIVRLCQRGTQTWLLDVKTGQWRHAGAKNEPRCGMGAAMCHDSKRNRILVFGGRGRDNPDPRYNAPGVDLWSYTVAENEWKPLPRSPIPGRAAGMDYDPVNDCVVVHFSLVKGESGRTLFYRCDTNEWRALPAASDAKGPSAPWHGLAYDAARNVFVRAAYTRGEQAGPTWWLLRPDPAKAEAIKPVPVEKNEKP
jgi:hypothetical protein